MTVPFQIYNHSNDNLTMAIRAEQDVVRQLAAVCTGVDENVPNRTLDQYIQEADVAVRRPRSFYRHVEILWRRDQPVLVPQFANDRRFRVTYSGNLRPGGGISFEGYCIVDRAWWAALMPLHQTAIQVEYIVGSRRDLMIVT